MELNWLWKADYDILLEIRLPEQIHLTGCGDNVATTIIDILELVDFITNRIDTWLNKHHLKLAKEKAVMAVLTRQKLFCLPYS